MNRGLLADKPVPDTATKYPPHFAKIAEKSVTLVILLLQV